MCGQEKGGIHRPVAAVKARPRGEMAASLPPLFGSEAGTGLGSDIHTLYKKAKSIRTLASQLSFDRKRHTPRTHTPWRPIACIG